ncbi:MAG TPA: TonB-dependent receptor, partial [Gammaproteobacteria bacterium]|nr:TonB-dependent receptor [Gammaproteobacteria bacterium]
AQDEIRIGKRLTLTAGLRYDDYSDSGDSLSPRIATVWRTSDRHIFKAQYGEAFRPPTLYEAGGYDLDPATIETTEAGYIYKGARREARATVFYSEIKDLVIYRSGTGYTNTSSARLHGAELEASMHLNHRTRIGGNLSYVDSEDDSTGRPLAGSATWHGNLFGTYRPATGTRIDLRLRFLDEYHRHPTDPRDAADGYETLDLTASFDEPWSPQGWSAHAGVKNALDAEGRFPIPLASGSTGDPVVTYNGDLPRPDRTWWLQLRYTY